MENKPKMKKIIKKLVSDFKHNRKNAVLDDVVKVHICGVSKHQRDFLGSFNVCVIQDDRLDAKVMLKHLIKSLHLKA